MMLSFPRSTESNPANFFKDDLSLTTPFYPYPAIGDAAVTQDLTISAHPNGSNIFLFYMNNGTFRADYK